MILDIVDEVNIKMDKLTFISTITPILRQLNYRKKGNYWYRAVDSHICCINVQGSQWNKDDYYVQIGFSFLSDNCKSPTLLDWYCRHRCVGHNGEINILPEELFSAMENVFGAVSTTSEIFDLLDKCNAVKIVSQFWF